MDWLSLPGLALLVAANTAPVVAASLAGQRAAWPLDCGLVLGDGRRLLGGHKTWRGLAAATLAAGAVALAFGLAFRVGALAGASTIAGDALSSFVKRRLDRAPGAWIPGLDQLPESVLPLAVSWHALGLDAPRFTLTVAVFTVLDLLASRLFGSSRRSRRPPPDRRDAAAPDRTGH
ncbi:MAG TPA: CDP-archaeol synthase [Planctomycetota bacterium]|nr:CDP-archaeol synthase [Planctomycetota bacterium]